MRRKKGGVRSREYTCGGSCVLIVCICIAKIIVGKKKRIGSLASHLGILDDEFEEILDVGKLSKIRYWYNKLGLHVQTHRDHSITWIAFDEEFALLKWANLPRHHIIGENTHPAWVCHPSCG